MYDSIYVTVHTLTSVASSVQGTAVLAVTSIAEEWSLNGASLLPGDQLRFTSTASTDALCADAAAAMPLTAAGDTYVELYYTAAQAAAAGTGAVTPVTGRFTFAETDGGATAYACVKFGSSRIPSIPSASSRSPGTSHRQRVRSKSSA